MTQLGQRMHGEKFESLTIAFDRNAAQRHELRTHCVFVSQNQEPICTLQICLCRVQCLNNFLHNLFQFLVDLINFLNRKDSAFQ